MLGVITCGSRYGDSGEWVLQKWKTLEETKAPRKKAELLTLWWGPLPFSFLFGFFFGDSGAHKLLLKIEWY